MIPCIHSQVYPMDNMDEATFKDKTKVKAKELLEKGKENTQKLRQNIQKSLEDPDNEKTYASLAYLPVLGVIICFLFKRKQKLTMIHAKNSAYVQIAFLGFLLGVWLLSNVPVISHILKAILFVPIITNALLYVGTIAFIATLGIGYFNASHGKIWVMPYLFEIMESYFNPKKKNSHEIQKSPEN